MKYIMDVWDKSSNKYKTILVENGSIRHYSKSTKGSHILKLNTSQYQVLPGKVLLETEMIEAFGRGAGMSYVKRLLLFGFSTIIHLLDVEYESKTETILTDARAKLEDCPLDYILGVRVPLARLTPSWIRNLKKQSIPIIIFYVNSTEEMVRTHWHLFIEAAFPTRTMFIFDDRRTRLVKKELQSTRNYWEKMVMDLRINTFFHLPEIGEEVPLLFLKRVGLYPKKGNLASGSDADYFMYLLKRDPKRSFIAPEVVAQKGLIIKAGLSWYTDEMKGKELTSTIPEQFLAIDDIYRYN